MKERPILFSGAMVRAILEGRKTQTRRVVKLQPRGPADIGHLGKGIPFIRNPDPLRKNLACPYGQPGDRLWVRETWGYVDQFFYRAAKPGGEVAYRADGEDQPALWGSSGTRWRPSIHMPRFACRLVLEVTAVRAERLQAITATDAWAEGIAHSPDVNPVHEFQELWASINGQASWDANPWVWVVEFRRVEA